jgi:3-deoxy-D-manno-octulosonic acid kinase
MMDLPEGYALRNAGSARIVAPREHLEFVLAAISEAGTLHRFASHVPDVVSLRGRGATHRIDTPTGPWVVRHYRRGGAAARWLGDRYARIGVPRPVSELRASAAARARGIDTPRVTAAVTYDAGPFYRADLATEFVPDAADLDAVTFSASGQTVDTRRAAWAAAGRMVKRAAAAGVQHADLNLKNVLIAGLPGVACAWLIDLDRCRVGDESVPSTYAMRTMAARLRRSLAKLERLHGCAADPALLAAFEDALHE